MFCFFFSFTCQIFLKRQNSNLSKNLKTSKFEPIPKVENVKKLYEFIGDTVNWLCFNFSHEKICELFIWSNDGEGEHVSPHEINKACRMHKFFNDYKKLMDEDILKDEEKEKKLIEIIKDHEESFLELVEFFDYCNKDC